MMKPSSYLTRSDLSLRRIGVVWISLLGGVLIFATAAVLLGLILQDLLLVFLFALTLSIPIVLIPHYKIVLKTNRIFKGKILSIIGQNEKEQLLNTLTNSPAPTLLQKKDQDKESVEREDFVNFNSELSNNRETPLKDVANSFSLLVELSFLEEKIYEVMLILPEITMQRDSLRNRGPHFNEQFVELDALHATLEQELAISLKRLENLLQAIGWRKNSLPSPNYPERWRLWWNEVRAEVRIAFPGGIIEK